VTGHRVLLVSHDAGGTVPPMLALAIALIAQGDGVTVLGQPSIRHRAEQAGCRFVAFEGIGDYDTSVSLEEQPERTLAAITGPGPARDLLRLVDEEDPDLVVVDCNLAGAAAAAETVAAPTALLLHSMYRTFVDTWFADYWPFMEPAINETRRTFCLDPCSSWPDVFSRHDRLLAVVPEVFDAPTAATPPTMRHFGFLVPPAAPEGRAATALPAADQPTVLVSLSTTNQHQGPLLQRIVEALGRLPVRALVTTSGVPVGELAAPPNVEVRDFVPHQQVLPHTDVVVTHGGLGTVAGALSQGVPLVCTPISRDQPLNAERVTELGAGLTVGIEPTADQVAEAVDVVLADPSYRRAALVIAQASLDAGGAAAAAAHLVSLTGEGHGSQ